MELVKKLSGGSLGFKELVIALLVANLGYSFSLKESTKRIEVMLARHIGWHKGRKSKT